MLTTDGMFRAAPKLRGDKLPLAYARLDPLSAIEPGKTEVEEPTEGYMNSTR
jgi:hypothetical protein